MGVPLTNEVKTVAADSPPEPSYWSSIDVAKIRLASGRFEVSDDGELHFMMHGDTIEEYSRQSQVPIDQAIRIQNIYDKTSPDIYDDPFNNLYILTLNREEVDLKAIKPALSLTKAFLNLGRYEDALKVWQYYCGKGEDKTSIAWLKYLEGAVEKVRRGETPVKSFTLYHNNDSGNVPISDAFGLNVDFAYSNGDDLKYLGEIKGGILSYDAIKEVKDWRIRESLSMLLRGINDRYRPGSWHLDNPDLPEDMQVILDPNLDNLNNQQAEEIRRTTLDKMRDAAKFVEQKFGTNNQPKAFPVFITFLKGDLKRSHALTSSGMMVIDIENGISSRTIAHEYAHLDTPNICGADGVYKFMCEGIATWIGESYERSAVDLIFGSMVVSNRPKVGDFYRAKEDNNAQLFREDMDYQLGFDTWKYIEAKYGEETARKIVQDIEKTDVGMVPFQDRAAIFDKVFLKYTGKTAKELLDLTGANLKNFKHGLFSDLSATYYASVGMKDAFVDGSISLPDITPVRDYLRQYLLADYGNFGRRYSAIGLGYGIKTVPVYPLKWGSAVGILSAEVAAGVNINFERKAKGIKPATPFVLLGANVVDVKVFDLLRLSLNVAFFADLEGYKDVLFGGGLHFTF